MEGYIKLYRSSLEDPLFMEESFTKWQAWCDLLLLAYHSESSFWVRGIAVKAQRGCVYMSAVKLSKRWGWSKGKVDRFLRSLTEDGRINVTHSNVINCIQIVNYEKYQGKYEKDAEEKPSPVEKEFQKITEQLQEIKSQLAAMGEKEEKKSKKKKDADPLVTGGREIFEKKYFELYGESYYWQAKDAVAVKSLTNKIANSRKARGKSTETGDLLKALEVFLSCINDEWIMKNFSVTIINAKYNEIVSQVKSKRNGIDNIGEKGKKQRMQDAASVIARLEKKERENNKQVWGQGTLHAAVQPGLAEGGVQRC